jgi:hypothetical protein
MQLTRLRGEWGGGRRRREGGLGKEGCSEKWGPGARDKGRLAGGVELKGDLKFCEFFTPAYCSKFCISARCGLHIFYTSVYCSWVAATGTNFTLSMCDM